MAKAKSDTPPFQMIVERGPRLVPANASDAERLDTWRVGSRVSVQFVRNGSRVMERKWWAILGLVIDRCNVPWTTKEQASEAIKLALGIVNLSKTVGGAWMQYPKSLTELTDPELDAAVRNMMDLITKMTGIDPETLRKETADVGRDEQEQPATLPHNDAGSGSSGAEIGSDTHSPAAADESAAADLKEDGAEPDGANAGDDAPSSEQPPPKLLMQECRDKFLETATRSDMSTDAKRDLLKKLVHAWGRELPDHGRFVTQCKDAAARIVLKQSTSEKEREYLEALIK